MSDANAARVRNSLFSGPSQPYFQYYHLDSFGVNNCLFTGLALICAELGETVLDASSAADLKAGASEARALVSAYLNSDESPELFSPSLNPEASTDQTVREEAIASCAEGESGTYYALQSFVKGKKLCALMYDVQSFSPAMELGDPSSDHLVVFCWVRMGPTISTGSRE